jgi:hypothetical protein
MQQLLDDGAVFTLEFMGERRGRRDIGPLVHFHPQLSVAVGSGGAGQCTVEAHQRHGVAPAAKLDALGDLGDDADLRVFVAAARHQQDAGVGARIDGEGYRHAGEDDGVVEGNQSIGSHVSTLRLLLDDVNY